MMEQWERRRLAELRYDTIPKEIKAYIHSEFVEHEAKEKEWVDRLMRAFPEQDLEAHRAYHEQRIKAARAEEEFWKTAKTELLRNGITALMAVIKWAIVLSAVGLAYKLGLTSLLDRWTELGP